VTYAPQAASSALNPGRTIGRQLALAMQRRRGSSATSVVDLLERVGLDRSTAALMGRSYANLAAGASPGEALRTAKLEMIRSGSATAKPYYWAPFQLFVGAQVVP